MARNISKESLEQKIAKIEKAISKTVSSRSADSRVGGASQKTERNIK